MTDNRSSSTTTSSEKHLKNMAQLAGTPSGEWILFPFIEGMIALSTETGGILERIKQKYQLTEYITILFEKYYHRLKPVGGSYAGAKQAPRTRANEASSSAPPPDDITGDSNLVEVLKDIALEKALDDRGKQELNESAAYFKLILEKALDDSSFGLRRNADKFMSFQPSGMSNAYEILDEIISELRPLEIIIMGPDIALTLEYAHATRFGSGLRIDEITQWRDSLFRSFRSSTPTATMSDSLLMERRPHLQQLVYFSTPSYEARLKLRAAGGDSTFHAVRTEVLPLINRIINTPAMTGLQISNAIRPVLKMYPATNMKTMQWLHSKTPTPRNTTLPPQAHAARRDLSPDNDPHDAQQHRRAHTARFNAAATPSPSPSHDRNRNQAPRRDPGNRDKAGVKRQGDMNNCVCNNCGKTGHWARYCPDKHQHAGRQLNNKPRGAN